MIARKRPKWLTRQSIVACGHAFYLYLRLLVHSRSPRAFCPRDDELRKEIQFRVRWQKNTLSLRGRNPRDWRVNPSCIERGVRLGSFHDHCATYWTCHPHETLDLSSGSKSQNLKVWIFFRLRWKRFMEILHFFYRFKILAWLMQPLTRMIYLLSLNNWILTTNIKWIQNTHHPPA